MNERNLSETQKRIIFIIGICVIFLGSVLFGAIFDPEEKGLSIVKFLPVGTTLLGLVIAFMTSNKIKRIKLLTFMVGLAFIISGFIFLNFFDVGKLVGLYSGGYWAGNNWAKSDIVDEVTTDRNKNKSL